MILSLLPVLHWRQVLQNTSDSAVSRPDSAALSRPNIQVMGGMGLSARTVARRNPCFEHPAHPLRFRTRGGGFQQLIPEPEAMTTKASGTLAASRPIVGAPAHYLRRVARSIVLRAALRGRIGWPVALLMLNKLECVQ